MGGPSPRGPAQGSVLPEGTIGERQAFRRSGRGDRQQGGGEGQGLTPYSHLYLRNALLRPLEHSSVGIPMTPGQRVLSVRPW